MFGKHLLLGKWHIANGNFTIQGRRRRADVSAIFTPWRVVYGLYEVERGGGPWGG